MDIRRLKIFLTRLDTRSFSNTAEALGLTQPTVSASLKALEEALGQKLFERTPRAVTPLPAAQLLAPYATTIVETSGQAAWAMGHHLANAREKLTIGSSSVPAFVFLPPALVTFSNSYPGVLIRLKLGASGVITQKVLGGELDLGLVGTLTNQDELIHTCFAQDRPVLVATRELADRIGPPPRTLEELRAWPLIMHEEGSESRNYFLTGLPEKADTAPGRLNIKAEVEGIAALISMVRASLGAAVVSNSLPPLVKQDNMVVMPLPFFGERRLFIVQRRARLQSPAASALISILRQTNRPQRLILSEHEFENR